MGPSVLACLLLTLPSLFQLSFPLCHENEHLALMEFKQSFVTDNRGCAAGNPKLDSWKLEGGDCCSWEGVDCDQNTGHVIGLDLSSSCLHGSLNPSSTLFHLLYLQKLNLAFNHFNYSAIPSALGNLSMLTHLNLSSSVFSGQIPFEISKLFRLSSLDLSDNLDNHTSQGLLELKTPDLKTVIHNLTSLEELHLSNVDVATPIPSVLANFSSLRSLRFNNSGLLGEFPTAIFHLPKLQTLRLPSNLNLTGYFPEFNFSSQLKVIDLLKTGFSGELPASIGDLVSLEFLGIGRCNFTGLLPSTLGNLPNLNVLDLAYNDFRGSVPSSLGNLTKLNNLQLQSNYFSGELPASIGNLIFLEYLYVDRCNFTRLEPTMFRNLSKLKALNLEYNSLGGDFPTSIGNLISLEYLYVDHCKFTRLDPDMFRNLSMLKDLNLEYNSFGVDLPTSIGNLISLEYLRVSSCNFTGLLPAVLGNLSMLKELHLSNNHFRGAIPSELTNLTQLTYLNLMENKIQGSVPSSISRLKKLTFFDVDSNQLSGVVELDAFLQLKDLKSLFLSLNNLNLVSRNTNTSATNPQLVNFAVRHCHLGEFPYFLHNQHQLEILDLSSNNIQGQIPKWMSKVCIGTLSFMDLSNNSLTGFADEFPTNPLPWSNLRYLKLDSNILHGPLPVPAFSTSFYSISNNSLTGEMPQLLCNQTTLSILDISFNNLSGEIPPCLSNFSKSLLVLRVRANNFHGPIPRIWRTGNMLKMIDLSENKLQGVIPRSLIHCGMLEYLDLRRNHISDLFPSWLGALPELNILLLSSNVLHGTVGDIPDHRSNFFFPKLRIIDLSSNKFNGALPPGYFERWNSMRSLGTAGNSSAEYMLETMNMNLNVMYVPRSYDYQMTFTNKGLQMEYPRIIRSLVAIDLSGNRFDGEIPESIGHLKELRSLNLSNNNLVGPIPLAIAKLTNLEALDLSQNKLEGRIPGELKQLNFLSVFKASHNNLTGPIPQGGQFDTQSASSFDGNPGLCGKQLQKECENPEASPPPQSQDDDSSFALDWKAVLWGYGSGFLFAMVIGHFLLTRKYDLFEKTFWKNQRRRRRR